MKSIISFLLLIFICNTALVAQTRPVKKTVTSKIRKDPKTGKVIKTITTTTVTDVVLSDGTASQTRQAQPKTTAKKKTSTQPTAKKVVAKAPAPKPIVKTNTSTTTATKEPEKKPAAIFANDETEPVKTTVVEKPATEQVSPPKSTITQAPKAKEEPQKQVEPILPKPMHRLHIGLRAGSNFAFAQNAVSLTSLPISATTQPKLGPMVGAFVNYALTKKLSLNAEIGGGIQGYKVTDGVFFDQKQDLNIVAPVSVRYHIPIAKNRIFVGAGAYGSYLLQSELKETGASLQYKKVDFAAEANNEIRTNRIDFGGLLSTGVQFRINNSFLEVELRYRHGIADEKRYSGTKPSWLENTGQNRVATASVAWLVPIGKLN